MQLTIKHPETEQEFNDYYNLRWRILRAPWGKPEGSEKDTIETECIHIMVCIDEKILGVGRLQFNSENEAQIRYMAVEKEHEGKGIGTQVVNALEEKARAHNIKTIKLEARETAVGFYKKQGYELQEKTCLLFNSIQHYRMQKNITS